MNITHVIGPYARSLRTSKRPYVRSAPPPCFQTNVTKRYTGPLLYYQ